MANVDVGRAPMETRRQGITGAGKAWFRDRAAARRPDCVRCGGAYWCAGELPRSVATTPRAGVHATVRRGGRAHEPVLHREWACGLGAWSTRGGPAGLAAGRPSGWAGADGWCRHRGAYGPVPPALVLRRARQRAIKAWSGPGAALARPVYVRKQIVQQHAWWWPDWRRAARCSSTKLDRGSSRGPRVVSRGQGYLRRAARRRGNRPGDWR